MKLAKILFAIFIIFSFTKGGVDAYNQIGEIGFPIFVFITALILSGLLLRSAFRPIQRINPNFKNKRFLWSFLKVFSIFGITGGGLSVIVPFQNRAYLFEVNGVNIPLDKCVEGNLTLVSDNEKKKIFYTCLASKLTADKEIKKNYQDELEAGKLDLIINNLKAKNKLAKLYIHDCYYLIKVKEWNEIMKTSLKQVFLDVVVDSKMEIGDVEKYCDCLVKRVVEFPVDKVSSGELYNTSDWTIIKYDCMVESNGNE